MRIASEAVCWEVCSKNYNKQTPFNEKYSEYIINFNYTSNIKIIRHVKREINVHGKYNQITIFGIDQSECKNDEEAYIF